MPRLLQPGGAQLFEAKVEAVHLTAGGASMGRRHSSPAALAVASKDTALLTGCFLLEHLALNVTHVQNLKSQQHEGEENTHTYSV